MVTDSDVWQFFDKMPEALPLYEELAGQMKARLPEYTTRVQKTQITFANKYNFGCVSLPIRKIKGRPAVYILVTFGLGYQVADPRIALSVEPHPNRWTHHVVVQDIGEIDGQLLDWIQEAYDFSMSK